MLLFVLVACVILIFSLSLHYKQHFRFESYFCSLPPLNSSSSDYNTCNNSTPVTERTEDENANRSNPIQQRNMDITTPNRQNCGCSLFIPIDGEAFDFFPLSFLFYIIFIIFLCIFIIIIDILNYHNNDESITDLLFNYSIISYHHYSLSELHSIGTWHTLHLYHILNVIVIFGIMILSLWDSLFIFYRYYKTISAKKLKEKSTKQIIKKYIVYYMITFVILFTVQTLVYYWIFPIIILFQSSFNFYCSFKFTSVLIERYKLFIAMDETRNTENQQILNSIYFMKNVSFICCILQSIYFGVFVIMYNVDIIYYLPMLWSISCIANATHFVRNRKFLQSKIAGFSRFCVGNNTEIKEKQNAEGIQNETMNDKQVSNSSIIDTKDKVTLNDTLEEVLKTQSILEGEDDIEDQNMSIPVYLEYIEYVNNPSTNHVDEKAADQISITIKNYSNDQVNDDYNTPKERWSNKAASSPNDVSISSFNVDKTASSPVLPILHLQEKMMQNQVDLNRNRVMSAPFDVKKMQQLQLPNLHENLTMDEAIQPFNILAKYGFCPRTSIIVMQQSQHQSLMNLKKYASPIKRDRISSVIVNSKNNNNNKTHKQSV